MATFQPGEIVDITIKGARIMPPKPGIDDVLTLAYEQTQPGVFATIELTHPAAKTVEIERVAPVEWPPVPGDLWRDRDGKVWFVYQCETGGDRPRTETRVTSAYDSAYSGYTQPAGLLKQYGPLTLVHREIAKES